jgi:hypothetical protein
MLSNDSIISRSISNINEWSCGYCNEWAMGADVTVKKPTNKMVYHRIESRVVSGTKKEITPLFLPWKS